MDTWMLANQSHTASSVPRRLTVVCRAAREYCSNAREPTSNGIARVPTPPTRQSGGTWRGNRHLVDSCPLPGCCEAAGHPNTGERRAATAAARPGLDTPECICRSNPTKEETRRSRFRSLGGWYPHVDVPHVIPTASKFIARINRRFDPEQTIGIDVIRQNVRMRRHIEKEREREMRDFIS